MKIAVLRPGALGDIIMCLQFMPELKRTGEVTFFADRSLHAVLKGFVEHYNIVNFRPFDEYKREDFDRVIAPQGYKPEECVPGKRMLNHLFHNYAADFGLAPSFDRLVLALPPRPDLQPLHYITIQNKTGWSVYKEWWGWDKFVALMREHIPQIGVVQIGGPGDPPVPGITARFCGRPFLDNLAGQCWADLHVGLDSVFNHTTNIIWRGHGRKKAIILWGSSQIDTVGYPQNRNISLGLSCSPCFRQSPLMTSNHFGPCDNPPGQVYEKPIHNCMRGITPEFVFKLIKSKDETSTTNAG